jgi:hypothetical protein
LTQLFVIFIVNIIIIAVNLKTNHSIFRFINHLFNKIELFFISIVIQTKYLFINWSQNQNLNPKSIRFGLKHKLRQIKTVLSDI